MDFDLSKENIQPLRGGRNVVQLGVALQAQTNHEIQKELEQQQQFFENAIRSYVGDDPLEIWYQYISWVEQSFPKHGHEGNLTLLLESCLGTFETDKRYTHDPRFCKLWIKYIDSQQNPVELYQMMHSHGLGVGCADLYKAWAYYHEAAGNFQAANNIFELGIEALAQPFDELQQAHKNLVLAAGRHTIHGTTDPTSLFERRVALTSLSTYKSGRVGPTRTPNYENPTGAYASTSSMSASGVFGQSNANAPISIYQDHGVTMTGAVGGVGPTSILTAVKKSDLPKENTIKPGPWTTVYDKRRGGAHHTPAFTVHVDDNFSDNRFSMPVSFPKETIETYQDWHVNMTIPEPNDNSMVPRYPKNRVYSNPTTEYSLEELRSLRYQARKKKDEDVIIIDDENVLPVPMQTSVSPFSRPPQQNQFRPSVRGSPHSSHSSPSSEQAFGIRYLPQQVIPPAFNSPNSLHVGGRVEETTPMGGSFAAAPSGSCYVTHATQGQSQAMLSLPLVDAHTALWSSPVPLSSDQNFGNQAAGTKFTIFEQSHEVQARGTAMKTPFKILSDEDLAETGSRGSTDVGAAAAQPMDSANVNPFLDDDDNDSNSSMEDIRAKAIDDLDDCIENVNTQVFNMIRFKEKCCTSTPDGKQKHRMIDVQEGGGGEASGGGENMDENDVSEGARTATKKNLFGGGAAVEDNNKLLSTIFEETKSSYGSSSNSSGATTKSTIFGSSKHVNMGTISEEHSQNLAANLKENEALRRSLLGNLYDPIPIDVQPQVDTSAALVAPDINRSVRTCKPNDVRPLEEVPTNPFKPAHIESLLRLVNFPGPHCDQYFRVQNVPKPVLRKEPFLIGRGHYAIEKVLGKGTFGMVFKAYDLTNRNSVALKYQKPANRWEFYICRELQARLTNEDLKNSFIDVTTGYFSDQASLLVYDLKPCGSLLNVANLVKTKSGKPMQECLTFYFCIEMLRIVRAMHDVKIIHADIKPDNFLLQLTPDNTSVTLQLIDFGCSIDMTLYPAGATFTRKVTTENFICCEMLEGRPWSYHTDMFCIAATAHALLFDKYLELQKKHGAWSIKERIPRYMRVDVWNTFFHTMLNEQFRSGELQAIFDGALTEKYDRFTTAMRDLVNLVRNR